VSLANTNSTFSLQGSFLYLRVAGACDSWKIEFEVIVALQRSWLETRNGHWKETVGAFWVFPDHSAWHLFTLNWVHNGASKPITAQTRP